MHWNSHIFTKSDLILLLLLPLTIGTQTELCWENIDCIVVQIFEKCFGNENFPIALIRNNGSFYRKLEHSSKPHLVALVDLKGTLAEYANRRKLYLLSNYDHDPKPSPTAKFLFDEIEESSFELAIYNLYHSVWWNIYGNFVIKNTLRNSTCERAHRYLKIIWKFDILKAIFICRDAFNDLQIFNFNPFGTFLSPSWKIIGTSKQQNNHPFTLLKLIDKSNVCDALNQDKTLSLGGYPIKVVGPNVFPYHFDNKTRQFSCRENNVYKSIFTKLNGYLEYSVFTNGRGQLYQNGTVDGMLAEVLQGNFDYYLPFREDETLWRNQIYLFTQTKYCCITKKIQLPAKLRIANLITVTYLIMITFGLMATTLTLMYLNRERSFSRAGFDVLLLVLGMPTIRKPVFLAGQIIFSLFLLSQIILSYVQQGDLFSAITVPIYDSLIESEQDLLDQNYQIFGLNQLRYEVYPDPPLSNRIQVVPSNEECVKRMKHNDRSACITQCFPAQFYASESSTTHFTEAKNYASRYAIFVNRDNFSLHPRVSLMALRLQEGGILKRIMGFDDKLPPVGNTDTSKAQTLTFEQMYFSYIFAMYGWAFSFTVLIFEILLDMFLKYVFPKFSKKFLCCNR